MIEDGMDADWPSSDHATGNGNGGRPREDPGRSRAVIGPANAGKTTLLLVLQQAYLVGGNDEYNLDFVADGESTLGLTRRASEFVFRDRKVASTHDVVDYPFTVVVENRATKHPEFACRMCVTDGPGGYLFPQEQERAWTSASASLSALISETATMVPSPIAVPALRCAKDSSASRIQRLVESVRGPDPRGSR